MAAIDWTDREVRHRVEAVMVNPGDLDDELGVLPTVVGSAQIDRGYYTDDRTGGTVETAAWDDYVLGAWIRLYHVGWTPATGDVRVERGTFAIRDSTIATGAGGIVFTFDLMSALGAISQDYDAWPMSIGQGAKASAVIKSVCEKCGRPYRTGPQFVDYLWRTGAALEAGETFRSRLFAICTQTGNRMDVDAHGRLTFRQYVAPAQRTASMTLDVDDSRSVIVDGSIEPGTNLFTRPARSVVVYKDGDKVISAQADVAQTSPTSRQRRGFTVAELHELHDMGSPKTVSHAQQLAKSYLAGDSAPTATWQLETLWLPLDQGDVVEFAPRRYDPFGDGGARKCLVQTVEETVDRLRLTLKEV